MATMRVFRSKGFLFELDGGTLELAAQLEHDGLVKIATRTVEGVYLEPAGRLAPVVAAMEEAGAHVLGFRNAEAPRVDRSRAGWRPHALSRIRNPLSPCWLPTTRAAA